MKLKAHLQSNNIPKIVGLLSFQSYLQIVEKFSTHYIDNIALATINDRYKVYSTSITPTKRDEFLSEIQKYTSMEGLTFWINEVLPDNAPITLFYSLNETDKWFIEYGITTGKDLYIVGKFNINSANISTLPVNKLLKDFKAEILTTDFRIHTLLNLIRKSFKFIDLGHCATSDVKIINNEAILSVYNLGVWSNNFGEYTIDELELKKYGKVFQLWASKQQYNDLIELSIIPYNNRWLDFVIKLKN